MNWWTVFSLVNAVATGINIGNGNWFGASCSGAATVLGAIFAYIRDRKE